MQRETPHSPPDETEVYDALAEIRACRAELEAFVTEHCQRWDRLADDLLAGPFAQGAAARQSKRDAIDDQIERLAAIAADLAQSVAEQQRLTPVS